LRKKPRRARGFFRGFRCLAPRPAQRGARAMMFATQKPVLALLVGVLLAIAGCAMTSTRQATAQALDNILADSHRPAADRARDRYRHPKDTLLFFGIRPEMKVLEVWPEPGWYTDVIAPLLRARGKYYAGVIAPNPESRSITNSLDAYREKLASRPDLYDRVAVVTFPTDGADALPPNSVDMILTFRNLHDWMARGEASKALATMYREI